MPTNQEWLNQLASESPDELKAWFDAEHNDNLAVENDVSGEDVDVMTEKRTKTEQYGVDSREKLEADIREFADENGWLYPRSGSQLVFNWLDRQAEITELQYEERVANIERQIGAIKAANDDYRDEVNRLQRRNDELRTSYDKLKRERDNLAADLLACNREREQLREHLGIALDHAHDICSLVDIDGNVLDVGD